MLGESRRRRAGRGPAGQNRGVPAYVALLRAVNVGGKSVVSMSALRSLFTDLGFTDVTTYVQSGNVLFRSPRAVTPQQLDEAIAEGLGRDITVMLRTPSQLQRLVAANPFPHADTSKLHVGFMATRPPAGTVARIDAHDFEPEAFAVRGRELYLYLPKGMGRTKLPAFLERQLKTPWTARSWKTVSKLIELAPR